jgi:nucleoside-diphosphate-sugar epimerase
MRILITGAGGFIGHHLCEHLSAQGHYIKAIVRSQPDRELAAAEVLVIPDYLNPASSVFQGYDCVIHLAARAHILKEKIADPLAEFREINVNMARRWVEEAGRSGVKRFVLVSSAGVNGSNTCGVPYSEDMPVNPIEPYAISKLEAEHMLRTTAEVYGMEYVIVRPPLVYGTDAPGNFALLLKLAKTGWPLPFGRVNAKRNMVSVWNLADFLRCCCEHPAAASELFLVSDREEVTLPEIFKYLGEGSKRKNLMIPLPVSWLFTAARLLGKDKAFAKLVAEFRVDTGKATRLLNWAAPYSAAESLRRTGKELR